VDPPHHQLRALDQGFAKMEAVWSSGSHTLGKDAIKCGNQHIFNEAPGSSHICLSGEIPDFGSQKCNNLGLKSAIRYKACHVIKNVTCCHLKKKNPPQLSVHDLPQLTLLIRHITTWYPHLHLL
jgi:hypothetical protein